ncbi:MAG: insulinase family protein [Hyphomonadaceae bacterium]|nr:insulinase family protein [Hyphomonadaceae bacterium]
MKWMISSAMALALGAGAVGAVQVAEAQQRTSAATPSAVGDVHIPYETFTLRNGLRVVVHTDRKAPVVAVGIWYGVGSRDERPGKTGFAHLFEHLMFNGSENYNGEWFKPFEQVGATDQNGTTWFDRTNYFQTVPKTALEMTLFLESDRMGHLLGVVDQARLDEQRGVVQNEKRQGDNRPYGLVEYAQLAGLFPEGHPYRWSTIGSMDDLNAASLEDVKAWFREYYGASNAVLALAGDIDVATARPLIEKYFAEIDPGPPLSRREVNVPIKVGNTRDVLRDRVPQTRAFRAWTAPSGQSRDATLLDIAAQVLGGGKSSRLYKALVIDQKVATNVSVSLQPFELASILEIDVTLAEGQNIDDVMARAEAVVAQFLASGPTAAEVERVKTGRYAGFVRGIERVGGFSGKITVLAEGWLYADDPGHYRKELQWLREATPVEVRNAARTWMAHGWHQVDVVPFGNLAATPSTVNRSAGVPTVATTPELTFPTIEQGRLANGARVVVARRPGAATVEVQAAFNGGYTADVGRGVGTASFTMGMLDEGTATRSAVRISEEAEALGARLSTGSGIETANVTLSALKNNLTPSLALMADVIRNPSFAQNEIDRVKTVWLAGIRQEKANPNATGMRLLPLALYPQGSPYGVPLTGSGTEASIGALTRGDMQAFHAERIRPDNATFYVVGDLSLAEATAAIDAAFRGWAAPATPLRVIPTADNATVRAPRLILVDRPNAPQSIILAGRATTPSAAPAALAQQMMNRSFGGAFTSRINMNLREEKGWSYGVRSSFIDARGQRPWFVSAPVQSDKTIESIRELQKEFADVVGRRPLSQEEFNTAVTFQTRALPGAFETNGAVLGALAGAEAAGRPLDWTPTLPARLKAMTLAEAQASARDVIDPSKLVWIVVGDRAKLEAGLRGLNIAPLEIWDEDGKPVAN